MKTKGIVTSEQITEYQRNNGGFLNIPSDINTELSLKGMLISCFAYGGIDKNGYDFKRYILPYMDKMNKTVFDSIYNEMSIHFSKCKVINNIYTDYEGCSYNSIIYPQ